MSRKGKKRRKPIVYLYIQVRSHSVILRKSSERFPSICTSARLQVKTLQVTRTTAAPSCGMNEANSQNTQHVAAWWLRKSATVSLRGFKQLRKVAARRRVAKLASSSISQAHFGPSCAGDLSKGGLVRGPVASGRKRAPRCQPSWLLADRWRRGPGGPGSHSAKDDCQTLDVARGQLQASGFSILFPRAASRGPETPKFFVTQKHIYDFK